MSKGGFRFIDLPSAAERLGLTRTQLLEIVDEGKIKPFSGKGQQSVFRAGDVDKLAVELQVAGAGTEPRFGATESDIAEASADPAATTTRRPRRRDPIKLIGTRLSMDSRWADISDEDITAWLDATEPVQYERVRKVAALAIERLEKIIASIEAKG